MRICHVLGSGTGWGGMERGVVDLATIQSATHDVTVVGAPSLREHLRENIHFAPLPLHLNRRDPRLIWAARQQLKRLHPDIIHTHGNKAASIVKWTRFFLPRTARVATVHGTKRSTGMFASYDRVIAVSRRAGEQLGRSHTVVWNGVAETPETVADTSGLPFIGAGKPIVIAVGRLVPVKGFDILISALKSVDTHLWLVGDGPEKAALEKQARTEGVAERIWFAGYRNDVSTLMRFVDLFVISSRKEGFPYVLVEALHKRLPVVATFVGGAEEILPQKWMCACEDPAALAALLTRALQNKNELKMEFEPVFEMAERELTLESASRKVEDVYREALAATGKGI